MSLPESAQQKGSRSWWALPAVGLMIGVAYFIAGWIGGDMEFAIFGLALMVATTALFLVLSRFSETFAGLLDRRDERINHIDAQATQIAGLAVIVAVIVGFVVEIAQGEDGAPYAMLGAIGGLAYIGSLVFLRFSR